jgi:AbrB family looped-hinge helix DNA binding protein
MKTVGLQEPKVGGEQSKVVEELRVRTRIGKKGRIVIPAPMREALGMAEGDVLDLRVVDGELRRAAFGVRRNGFAELYPQESLSPMS